jgi:hypothetical protein
MKIILTAHPPFSLSSVVHSHGWSRLAPFGADAHSEELTYIERMDTGLVVELLIREATDGVGVEIDGQISKAELDEVACKIEWMLNLEQDFSAFYALANGERKSAGTFASLPHPLRGHRKNDSDDQYKLGRNNSHGKIVGLSIRRSIGHRP